ncbi:MAG TPA: MAPEG family protein [Sphingobium sp.]|uniref:MAPEG family protein n=1 Tax=Sphingobium sp. TaxID=1912891 RepID=UPI002ECFC95C
MPNAVNPVSIFLPVLVVVALTFIAFIRMAAARGAVAKDQDPNFYRAHIGAPEPETAVVAVRHYGNLFELPTLFYAACISAFVLQAVGEWTLRFAWTYVAARIVQSAIHLTYNNPAHRGLAFVVGMVGVIALWVNLALVICARL